MWHKLIKTVPYLLIVMLLISTMSVLYAEAKGQAGDKKSDKSAADNPAKDNKENKGDNRDDSKSGKIDRIGDGNSGQGDDKKPGYRPKPPHDIKTCPICRRHLPPPSIKKDANEKVNQGVRDWRDWGKGEGRDFVGQGGEQKKWSKSQKDIRDRIEDRRDRREDVRDRREDNKDKAEQRRREIEKENRERAEKYRKYLLQKKVDDNRDDSKSGKSDRIGDGNSGQGNDKKLLPPRPRIQPYPPKQGDNRDDSKSGKIDRSGDGNSGQGDDKKPGYRPPHDIKTCPICKRHRHQLPPPPIKKDANEKINQGVKESKDKINQGVRDWGKGEGRDSAGQGKGQGDTRGKGTNK
ncbi:MAG: hypothetical protein QME51_00130 [Planctomycetota bacterium]|nr:hypothetical protein [Planctomycetota bacterium]MDI6786766.1 hypothetical protein [Planctomycetota bacterium]